MKKYNALVIGGTGYVGKVLIETLISRPGCAKVVQICRRPLPGQISNNCNNGGGNERNDKSGGGEKLETIILPTFDNLKNSLNRHPIFSNGEKFDVAFCMMGTRHPTNIPVNEQQKVNVRYVDEFAEYSRSNGVGYFGYLSFVGASPHSNHTLSRLRGEAEDLIKQKKFNRTTFYRPAWISRPPPPSLLSKSTDDETSPSMLRKIWDMFDYYSREKFRMVGPFYWPVSMMPKYAHSSTREEIARAAVADFERYFTGQDESEMRNKIGTRGLKRLYHPNINHLSSLLASTHTHTYI